MKSHGNSPRFGIKQRTFQRKQRKDAIHRKVDDLLIQYLPHLKHNHSDPDSYEEQIQKFSQELEKLYPKFEDYREGRNRLSRQINKGNIDERWSLPVPEYLIRIKRPRPFRTEAWFKQVRTLNRWKTAWYHHLNSRTVTAEPAGEEEQLACCLISAALHGGLCIPEALLALAAQLKTQQKPFQASGEWVWIDLIMNCKSQALNYEADGKAVTLRRWYPDPLTLGIIARYLRERTSTLQTLDEVNVSQSWNLVKNYAKNIDHEKDAALFNIKSFCRAAIGVTENLPGVRLPQALVEYSVGRIPSASIPPMNQQAILHSTLLPKKSYSINDFTKFPTNQNKSQRVSQNVTCNFEKLIANIRQVLGSKKSPGTKITRNSAVQGLQRILTEDDLPNSAHLIVDWLYTLLHNEKNAVSTAKRYFSAIGKAWLSATASIEFDDFDEADFESLYLGILDAEISEKSRRYNASRLKQLHAHGVIKLGFASQTGDLGVDSLRSQPSVRAAYLSESHFVELCHQVESIGDLDELTKQGLVCLLTISFRVGLRRGELLKLRVSDVEKSENRWLFIRNNRFGDNKSSSALRKIPLSVFLTPVEKDHFNAYFKRREAYVGTEKNALLFSMPITPHIPHDAYLLSSMTRCLLKSITDFDYTFHHLRHTAISRIYAVLEADDDLISVLSPYSAEDALKLRQAIHNVDESGALRDIYWSLAALAGHVSPETTFSNYIHFCDKALGNRLQQTTASFSKVAIAEMTGLTANKLTRICNQHNVVSSDIPVQILKSEFLKNIEPYQELIVEPKPAQLSVAKTERVKEKIAITTDQCHAVLRDAENEKTLVELSMEHQIPETIISKWVKNARYINRLKTRAHHQRAFSAYRVTTPIGEFLAPSRPTSNAERLQAKKAIDVLRKIYKTDKAGIEWCIRYYFRNTHMSRSGIEFVNKDELIKFAKIFGPAFSLASWRFHYHPLKKGNEYIALWQQAAEGMVLETLSRKVARVSKFPCGKGLLYLRHPQETELLAKDNNVAAEKYGSSAIRYIIHMLAIMLAKVD